VVDLVVVVFVFAFRLFVVAAVAGFEILQVIILYIWVRS
jgi:hypothetical protein